MSNPLTDPETDADRIRMKRLAKLQQQQQAQASSSGTSSPSASTPAPAPSPKPKPKPAPAPPKRAAEPSAAPSPVPPKKKASAPPPKFNAEEWENNTITDVFRVTLDPGVALTRDYEVVWLKSYMEDEAESLNGDLRLNAERLEPVVIARLDLNPNPSLHDEEYQPFLSRVPRDLTVFEYLVSCWKRLNAAKTALLRRGYLPAEVQQALPILDRMRHLIVSYVGINFMSPDAFPCPPHKVAGASELVESLLSLGAFSNPLFGGSGTSEYKLDDTEISTFLADIVRRFAPDGELPDVLSDVIRELLWHPSLAKPEGLAASDSQWRGVIGALEALAAHKDIARMITSMEEWNPPNATAADFETASLLGPLFRLNVFPLEWPSITKTYFTNLDTRPAVDIESARNTLRGALRDLHGKLFKVLNVFVRADAQCRDAVLGYISRAVNLNIKRSGSHVDPNTVATDSFMVNLYAVLLQFAEPFMDANYSKLDRIDRHYYARSSRIELKDETRINATSDEANGWVEENKLAPGAAPPNFISDIFYLTLAVMHYGLCKTMDNFEETSKHLDELKRHLKTIEGDRSWEGTAFAARVEASIRQVKSQMETLKANQHAYMTQLMDQELLFKSNTFTSFVVTWLIRFNDPAQKHPRPTVELPLPQEVSLDFRVLPEYILDNVIEYYVFLTRSDPRSLNVAGKEELLVFLMTFLTSTWYIKNPYLKNKIIDVLFYSSVSYYQGQDSLLGNLLNGHPVALKNLISALTTNYIEVESTGTHTQFYDKFHARREIASVLNVVWNNPAHRKALSDEALNTSKFVRFVNLMINDVTYLLDESLSDMSRIRAIELEMEDTAAWNAKTPEQKREAEKHLRDLERKATGYNQLGDSTVNLLKIFTAETKRPFMEPEIVDRLAAMLNYNLEALAGTRTSEINVKDKEKYHFRPKQLLSAVVQVYLNLADQGEFVHAVANDGRSYRKELFEKTAHICKKAALKSPTEIEQLLLFVYQVEEAKTSIQAEDDLGEIPEEFQDPLMATVMHDPVILPSSRAVLDRSTIKSILLSDAKDPFNRQPLSIEDVIPDVELKAKIDAFLSARRNKDTALDKAPEDVVMMDAAQPALEGERMDMT
ncbi:hypothetical protein PENSPDRAFT_614272 [Peniophora sp. CONT]|nr:hypothetical protein PENSPDRAFT_614272 [Peniophora sp. CONT]